MRSVSDSPSLVLNSVRGDLVARFDPPPPSESGSRVRISPRDPAVRGESAEFAIGQPKTSAAELSFENPILLDQVVDDVPLMTVDPACESDQQELPRVERAQGKRW